MSYQDDDLVYVDPVTKEVIGPVEFDKNGNPIKRKYEQSEKADKKSHRSHYPWGTYRSMCSAFRLKGKPVSDPEAEVTMDEYLPQVLNDDY